MNGGDCFYDSTVLHDMVQTGLHADVIEALAVKKGTQELIRQHDPDLGRTLLTDCLCHQSTFIRRELLERFPYDETYKIASDWKFWLQTLLCHACTYQFVDRVVAAMDVNGITYSQLDLNKKERDAILAQFLPQGFAAPVISLIHEHHKMTHDILIQYVLFLEKHSMRSYHILRKMAKRMVNYVKWKKGNNQ
jgi:hypothetical protein